MPQFTDNHNIDNNYHKLRRLLDLAEVDLYKFLGPTRNMLASKRARRKFIMIRKLAHKISIGIMYQKQDFRSEY